MKPFDLESAKNGAKLCTRDGRSARIICYDADNSYPLVALIKDKDGKECISTLTIEGKLFSSYSVSNSDLFLADNSFNLEQAKSGISVCTREGNDVDILTFTCNSDYPIVGLVNEKDGSQSTETWTESGKYNIDGKDSCFDLMMKQ